MNKWNVCGKTTIEELADDRLPECVRGRGIDNVDIDFRSIGYRLEMSMYGGPDGLGWPAEGDDERTLETMVAWTADGCAIPLTPEEQSQVFEAFYDEVNDAELPYDDGRD